MALFRRKKQKSTAPLADSSASAETQEESASAGRRESLGGAEPADAPAPSEGSRLGVVSPVSMVPSPDAGGISPAPPGAQPPQPPTTRSQARPPSQPVPGPESARAAGRSASVLSAPQNTDGISTDQLSPVHGRGEQLGGPDGGQDGSAEARRAEPLGSHAAPPAAEPASPAVAPARPASKHWQGRPLQLPFDPTPANMSKLAQLAREAVANVDKRELDFLRPDVARADKVLHYMHLESSGSDAVAESVFCFGCYLGEVLVHAGGHWEQLDPKIGELIGVPVAVVMPSGAIANPIGRAFKRVEDGERESLVQFYDVFVSVPAEQAD